MTIVHSDVHFVLSRRSPWSGRDGLSWYVYQQDSGYGQYYASGPFLRKRTAYRIADDLLRVRRDGEYFAALAPHQPEGGDNGRG